MLPWGSMGPLALDSAPPRTSKSSGADDQDRTGDLVLTKDALCQLSYIGSSSLERETGIEPATNSLEGCDSTTELLPQNSPSPCLGGEGRIRTSEAARATDLQSAAFDRFATSPDYLCLECVMPELTLRQESRPMELAEGFEPPTG